MILSTFRICAVGALLCGLAAPAAAAEGSVPAVAAPSQEVEPRAHSRRVELPFLLDFRPTRAEPRQPAARRRAAPHPYRELEMEQPLRAALDAGRTGGARLSPSLDFG